MCVASAWLRREAMRPRSGFYPAFPPCRLAGSVLASTWASDTLEPGSTLYSALNRPVHPFQNDTASELLNSSRRSRPQTAPSGILRA